MPTRRRRGRSSGGGASDRRAAMKQQLIERTKQSSTENVRQSKGILKAGLTNVDTWKCNDGDHVIDILPYQVGVNDPRVIQGKMNAGEWAYFMPVFMHQNVGPDADEACICLKETYGERCPICAYRARLSKDEADDDLIKALLPSKFPRCIYNIVVYDSEEEERKGVQVWQVSAFFMENFLAKLAKGAVRPGQRTEKYIAFADPDEGRSISFNKEGTGLGTKYIAHQFLERDYEISDDLLDAVHCLDELVEKPSYDQIKALFHGERPAAESSAPETEEPEEEQEESPPPTRRRRRRPSQTQAEEEPDTSQEDSMLEFGDIDDAANSFESDDEFFAALEERDLPALKTLCKEWGLDIRITRRTKKNDLIDKMAECLSEDGSPDDESGGQDAPAGDNQCPGGGKFGHDIETLEACDSCQIWEECSEEADRLGK